MFEFLFNVKSSGHYIDKRIEKILNVTEAFYAQLDHEYKIIDKSKVDLSEMFNHDETCVYELLLMDNNVKANAYYYYDVYERDRGLMRSERYQMSVWGYRVKVMKKEFNPSRNWKEILKMTMKRVDDYRPY